MKLYNKMIMGLGAVAVMAGATSCNDEKATLGGADAVYIELTPTNPTLAAGDTAYVSAVVSNVAGDVIDTPVKWTVDDESVAKVVVVRTAKPGKVKKSSRADEGEGDGEEEGGGFQDGDEELLPGETPAAPVDSIITYRTAVIGMQGAQGKSTKLRATLENGDYAVTQVSVVSRELNDALAVATTNRRSYSRDLNDTIWFTVKPFSILDECTVDFELRTVEVFNASDKASEMEFTHPWPVKADNIVYQDSLSRVGVVYTGPRACAKAELELTLTNLDGETVSATAPFTVYPEMSPGFEVDGKRPGYGPPTPSNIKQLLINPTMDINSTHLVGVCLGVQKGADIDVLNASAAEDAGICKWEIEGSAVVVEDAYYDYKYDCPSATDTIGMGYVTYLKLRSGSREGLTVIRYVMPDTVLVCNLKVENYKVSHPVNEIIVSNDQNGDEVITSKTFRLQEPADIYVSLEPAASMGYHTPVITSSDPSVISVNPYDPKNDGGCFRFELKKLGSAVLTITALDKSIQFPVEVIDRVTHITWPYNTVNKMFVGNTEEITAQVNMASGAAVKSPVTWKVDNPAVATVTTKPGTLNVGVVKALTEGTVKIVAECEGVESSATTIEVVGVQNLNVSDYPEDENYVFDNGDGTMGVAVSDVVYAEWLILEDGVLAGTFTGTGAYLEWDGIMYDDCSYNLTITDNGDGTYTITGYIEAPNGGRVIFNGETFYE